MSIWSPQWRILANGTNLTDLTLVGFTIQTGRNNVYTQPQAGYASIQVINLNNINYNLTVNTALTIELKDSNNAWIPIFGGRISDLSQTVQRAGNTAIVTRMDITAIGAIARMYKTTWDGSLSKEFDGDQIYTILSDLLINSWNEVAAGVQWDTYNTTETWANAQDIGLGSIDQPGQYEMVARNADPIDVYSIVTQIANSALGYIYEDAQGNIGYADAAHRTAYLAANGYVELDANHAFGNGLRSTISNQNIVNRYVVNYGNNYSNSETAEDLQSIGLFGPYAATIFSNLDKQTDAEAVAARQIELRSFPRPFFDSITFPLQNPEIDDADRDALIGVFMGLPVKLVNLPSNINGGEFTGYVEGWSWRSSINGVELTLTVSPTEFSAAAQQWEDVNALETWNSILNTLEWQDAIGVIS